MIEKNDICNCKECWGCNEDSHIGTICDLCSNGDHSDNYLE